MLKFATLHDIRLLFPKSRTPYEHKINKTAQTEGGGVSYTETHTVKLQVGIGVHVSHTMTQVYLNSHTTQVYLNSDI